MAAFPDTIACIITTGFSESPTMAKKYLGNRTDASEKATASVTAVITSHAEMDTFTSWYITTINNGRTNFTLDVPFFGVRRAWDVRLIAPITTKPNSKYTALREIPMKVEILDDISTYLT